MQNPFFALPACGIKNLQSAEENNVRSLLFRMHFVPVYKVYKVILVKVDNPHSRTSAQHIIALTELTIHKINKCTTFTLTVNKIMDMTIRTKSMMNELKDHVS